MRGVRPTAPAGIGTVLLVAGSLAGSLAGPAATLRAQEAETPAAAGASAAGSITPTHLRRRIRVLAQDSMRRRDTPSPQLTAAARYVAAQFRAFGLRPGLGGSYLQYYPVTVIEPGPRSAQRLVVDGPDGEHVLRSGRDFVAAPTGTGLVGSGPLHRFDPDSGATASGAMLLVDAHPSNMPQVFASIRRVLRAGDAAGAIIVVDAADSYFAGLQRFFGSRRVSIGEPDLPGKPVALVQASALPEAVKDPLAAGETLPYGWTARLQTTGRVRGDSAMNVVGWLPGSDPDLQGEYVLYTAHLDRPDVRMEGAADSARTAADGVDSARAPAEAGGSGVATLLAVARAFTSAPQRPRRSLVFMTVSGMEKGLLGSSWYVSHPVFPLERTVADVDIDVIGRRWKDTVVAYGKRASSLGSTVDSVAASHPELGLTVLDDPRSATDLRARLDRYDLARKGIPVLFFSDAAGANYSAGPGGAGGLRFDKMARVGRLLYFLGTRVADQDQEPRWDPEAYRRLVGGSGSP